MAAAASAPPPPIPPEVTASAFRDACFHGRADVVKRGLKIDYVHEILNVGDRGGWPPLVGNAISGSTIVAKLLLVQKGINPNITANKGWTPIFFATFYGCWHVTRVYLRFPGLDPNIMTEDNEELLPIHRVCLKTGLAILNAFFTWLRGVAPYPRSRNQYRGFRGRRGVWIRRARRN